ncbi:hypothetical protein M0804_013974 [Polistes exclamans]|nr:hypothetical protein M0804_013974 [Polistes exclamans]
MHSDDDSLNSYISKASLMLQKWQPAAPVYSWLQKFESVADYIGVPDDRWVEFFYSMLEFPEDLNITKEEFSDNSFNYSYEAIKIKFLIRYAHTNIARLARDSFKDRMQYEHETIEKYAESLEKLHNECFYVLLTGERLKRQFVNGLRDEDIRISLKNTKNLTFNKVVKKAVEMRDILKNGKSGTL